ncbi:response regulator [Streptomyces sp. NPDC047968]|uniref:response regulator n=1 Tax=unclassified Streptomyces TaxID=2593676 RepID=UPI003412DBE8
MKQRVRIRPRIWHKLAAICLAFMIPLGLTATYLIREQNARIEITRSEITGLSYIQPLTTLLRDVSHHRSLSSRESRGQPVPRNEVASTERAIDQGFNTLLAVDPASKSRISVQKNDFTQRGESDLNPEVLATDWENIKIRQNNPDTDVLYDRLILNLINLAGYVGDTSKMALDPELDSGYALSTLTQWEPQITNRLYHLGDATESVLAQGASPDDKRTIARLSELVAHDLEFLSVSLSRAFADSPKVERSLSPLLQKLNTEAEGLDTMGEQLFAATGRETGPLEAYLKQLENTKLTNNQLTEAVINQAEDVLQDRENTEMRNRATTLASIGGVLALIIVFTALVSRRMVSDLSSVERAAQSVSSGDLGQRARVKSRDEIAALAHAFNAMAESLQESYTAIERKVRKRTEELSRQNASLELLEGVASAGNVASKPAEAGRTIVELVCSYMGWPVGHVRLVPAPVSSGHDAPLHKDSAPPMVSSGVWHFDDPAAADDQKALIEAVHRLSLGVAAQQSLESDKAWITDLDDDPDLANQRQAAGVELRTYLAFPILQGQQVRGVLEFLAPAHTDPDTALRKLMQNVGTQLGWVLERSQAAEDLRLSKGEAEAANEAKSTFLATMSHEIRTPLNSVIGMTDLLLETPLEQEQQNFAQIIRDSGETLLAIINDILDFSKMEAGKLNLDNKPLNLRRCIESAFDLIASRASQKDLDLAYIITPGTPEEVLGDPVRLRQVTSNLLSNAVKFTQSGEVVLTVAAEAEDEVSPAGNEAAPAKAADDDTADRPLMLHFAVRDTGIGIPADRMKLLFHAFEQLDAASSRRFEGTGLGLAISLRLTDLMGGTMWAESTAGKGSTFHFTIQTRQVPAAMRAAPLEPGGTELEGKRLLVVDDNATNRMILTLQGESWGMVVRATESPQEALAWIRQGDPFDIGILDYHMPEMNGVALANLIRQRRDKPALPLILLTSVGRQDSETLDEFDSCHTKPIKADHLHAELCRLLGVRRPSTEPSPAQPSAPSVPVTTMPSLRILVAEDNPTNRLITLRMLGNLGYDAETAEDGLQALDALRHGRYDVVLMDVQMPRMDGLEASRRIHREWAPAARPRIIAMTANAMAGDRERCLAAGMDDYVSKPVRLEELARALERCRRREEEPGRPPAQGRTSAGTSAHGPGPPRKEEVAPHDSDRILKAETVHSLVGSLSGPFVAELITAFMEDSPALVAAIRGGVPAGDPDEVRRAAHTLRSNASTFGASVLESLCAAAEDKARAGRTVDVAPLIPRIEAEYDRCRKALQKLRAELTS